MLRVNSPVSTPIESLTKVPQIHAGVAWRAYDGEVMIVRDDEAIIRSLSSVGSFAFELFDGEHDLRSIAAAICDEFDVSEDTASADLVAFADDLSERGLIVWMP
jgi:hypothetical protein